MELGKSGVAGRWRWWVLALLAAQAAGAAVLEGFVVEHQSGRPVARARITLQTPEAQAGALQGTSNRLVFTDSRGYFSHRTARGAAVLLTAEKRGYATVRYGQRRWNGPGTPIVLEGDAAVRVEVRLQRLGAVSGTVTDENGLGLPDIPVFAYRDAKPLRLAGRGASDDRGAFRIAGLEPGRYRIRTGPKQLEDDTGLLPTFYGDTTAVDGSTAVDVRLDEDSGGVSIRPAAGTLLKLSGRVDFPGAGAVALYSDMGRQVAPVDNTGHFRFEELTPGEVHLMAESNLGGRPQAAHTRLWLTSDLADVVLSAAPAPTVQFLCEDREGGAARVKDVSLQLTRTSPPDDPRTQTAGCGDAATLGAGEWQFRVTTPSNYFVVEVRVQGRPAVSGELPLNPGSSVAITATVSAKAGVLKGSLLAPSGQPAAGALVFLRAADPAVGWRLFNKTVAWTGANGEFVFEGLPAGRYRVAGSFDVQTADEIDWSLPSLAVVDVKEGEEAAVTARL